MCLRLTYTLRPLFRLFALGFSQQPVAKAIRLEPRVSEAFFGSGGLAASARQNGT
jgi:hypothetical protein